MSLLSARDGTLWIGTRNGLASLKAGKLTQYPEFSGQQVVALLEDRDGSVWTGSWKVPTGRLCEIRNGSIHCYGEDGCLGLGVSNLFDDRKGNLWVGFQDGFWRWKPGSPEFYAVPNEPTGIKGFGEDDDGILLLGMRGGIKRFIDGKTEDYPLRDTVRPFQTRRILRDRDGSLWVGTQGGGLVHVHQGRTDVFGPSDGLTGDDVLALFEDREGSVWVATLNGLDRFRDYGVATFTMNEGLSSARVGSILPASDGSIWLATTAGLNRWNNGRITAFGTRGADGNDGKLNGLAPESLFQDHRGRIWVSTRGGIGYLENERLVPISAVPGGITHSIVEDAEGSIWIANQDAGLLKLFGNEVQQIPWASLGRKDYATVLAVDSARGGLWLGFVTDGIAYFNDGKIRATYAVADGLGEGRVNGFKLEPDGATWVATEGGLSRVKDGRVATLTNRNGLPCSATHWVIEDDAHSFWLYMTCGLVRIARSDLDAWAAAADRGGAGEVTIHPTVYESSNGVRGLAVPTRYTPSVARSSDGRLWFLPVDGVSVVDPRRLPFNPLPPPVHIEEVTADHKSYEAPSDTTKRLQLPSRIRDLEINYTALSLVAPETVLFRYKLEGRDGDWQEVGHRRQAFYNNLDPGNYRFRVSACNNSGVWNEAGTFLDFSVAPAYYQTAWFRMACLAAFLGMLAALYQLHLRQVMHQAQLRVEGGLEERERIARDLHDTLLQSVQGLMMKIHAVALKSHDVAARADLENALDRADKVLAEGRDRVRNLRSATVLLNDLPAAFKRVAEENSNGETKFKTVVEGSMRDLHPLVLEETYLIGREALINAFNHSKGSHVEIEITYDPRQFRMRVRDDGHGISPEILKDGGRPGHWGLPGMRERSERVGGQLKMWSGRETGTEIEFTVPGATAYRQAGNKARSSWLSRP
jgi:signal transduction histidine kinase/ligand-binding sensor domain-containing protein